jgi:pimeloyl-ACP methyl ester carboxylesterase
MRKAVILIHGLMTNSVVMRNMEKEMLKAGYEVYKFNYKSQKYSLDTLNSLNELVKSVKEDNIFIIGHSMGGLVARNYISHYKYKYNSKSNIKSVITIATPHNQSLSAHRFAKSIFKPLFGTAGDSGLTKQISDWNTDIPIGCIAGLSNSKLSANFFMLLTKRKAPGDGTVFLDEAILSNCTDKIIMEASHTGLLFKKDVANQCINFIETNKFIKK